MFSGRAGLPPKCDVRPPVDVVMTPSNSVVNGGVQQPMEQESVISNVEVSARISSAQTHSLELKRELDKFTTEKLQTCFVLSKSDVARKFHIHLGQLPVGHVLGRGVSEKMLHESLLENDAVLLTNYTEPMYLLEKSNDGHNNIRKVLVDMLKEHPRIFSSKYKQKLTEALGVLPSEPTWRKILGEYCEVQGHYWVLKGTGKQRDQKVK